MQHVPSKPTRQCDGELISPRWTAYVELHPPAYRVYARRARRRASLVRAAAGARYTVRTLKPHKPAVCVTCNLSRDYDGRLYRTQEVALSGHTAVAPPSILGLTVYLGLTWAGCSPLVRLRPATRAPGVPVGMAYVNTSARLPRRSGSKPPFRVRVGPVSCYSRRAITNVSSK
jgi:hypothetical protein